MFPTIKHVVGSQVGDNFRNMSLKSDYKFSENSGVSVSSTARGYNPEQLNGTFFL